MAFDRMPGVKPPAKRRVSTIPRRERPEKVTLLLPKDTVERLDYIADRALLGSRGRAVQALADEIIASEDTVRFLVSASFRISVARNQREATALLFLLLTQAGNLATRLDRFLDVKPYTDKQWEALVGAIAPTVLPGLNYPPPDRADDPRRGGPTESAH
jgi:hypothetical protein